MQPKSVNGKTLIKLLEEGQLSFILKILSPKHHLRGAGQVEPAHV